MSLTAAQLRRIRQRTKDIRAAINALDYVSSGTLHTRTKVCGRPNCRCAQDPAARHGPYFEWSRRIQSRLLHRVISEPQAQWVQRAIANHRLILRLLSEWEQHTAEELLQGPAEQDR